MRAALAVLGVLAALAASGAATVEQAQAAGMPGPVPFALVALLEVVNVAGTWTWLTDTRTRVQVEAAVGVAAASTVTATCGALSYGPLGLVAPAGVLFTVHLVGRLQHRAGDAVHVARPDQPVPAHRHAVTSDVRPESDRSHAVTPPGQGVSTPVDAPPVEPVVELPPEPPTAPSPVSPPSQPARPTNDEIVAALAARPVTPGRDAVRDEFGIGATRADKVRQLADAARRPRLVTEAAR